GGVAANKELRTQMKKAVKNKLSSTVLYLPPTKLTTDNAAMIAAAAYLHAVRNDFTKPENLAAKGNLGL
ncbi:MAG: tRNA (adenosine(37)-N6)-threonylcarbamoyltransferase complex transferase subunit TsaD, partial [Patescibacteria group bacterium]